MKIPITRIAVLSILFLLSFALTSNSLAAQNPDAFDEADSGALYVEEFIFIVESTETQVTDAIDLYDITSGRVIAVCYTLSTGGYAILDIETNVIYEYSLETTSPYYGQSKACYYAGPNNYFTEESNSLFIHTKDSSIKAKAADITMSTSDFSDYRASIRNVTPLSKKISDLKDAKMNPTRRSPVYLTNSLSTLNESGYCGPTSIHCVLKYQGKLRNPPAPGSGEIIEISGYTGQTVNLASLVSGTYQYLVQNSIYGSVGSSSYNWSLVTTRILADKPITLGTSGGGLATGGHVQTIHGYNSVSVPPNLVIYTLYVNDSWGNNNITLTYDNQSGTPSYLKDHVYVN